MSESLELTVDADAAPISALDQTLASGRGSLSSGSDDGRGRAQLQRGDCVGRYVIVDKLGAGAMGVVFAAYDPELDRKVALKLLKSQGSDGAAARVRLQREAQALAKLNHGNVVAVHDVGEHLGQVFVAMEFVDGQTLSQWFETDERRPWREIVAVFEAAGRGLAAAHAVGLVHRDFKPDNVMIGADGRVRVMDFGLARTGSSDDGEPDAALAKSETAQIDLTRTGALMGTPAYMAPEQFSGLEATPKCDQFSFCVALHEALFGVRPFVGQSLTELVLAVTEGNMTEVAGPNAVPGWLRRVVVRGLASDPSARFDDMERLLAALAAGDARRRRSVGLVALGLAGAMIASLAGYQRWTETKQRAACDAAGDVIAEVWNPSVAAELRDGLIATELPYASTVADKVQPWLDDQARAWREASVSACMNTRVDERWTEATYAKAQWCLEERRLELATLVSEMSHADRGVVQNAILLAADLPAVGPCVDERALELGAAPPEQSVREQIIEARAGLSRAAYLKGAGAYADGLAQVRETRARAEALGWAPLTVASYELEAQLLEDTGEFAAAEEAAMLAYFEAVEAGRADVASSAASLLTFVVGYRLARAREGLVWSRHAELALAEAGDPTGLREATQLSVAAVVHNAAGDYPESLRLHERALELKRAALGTDHPALADNYSNLGSTLYASGEFDRARELWEQGLALRERTLGSTHPLVAESHTSLGGVFYARGDLEGAQREWERALEIYEQALGLDNEFVAMTLNNLGTVHLASARLADARAVWDRALEIRERALGKQHPDVASTLNNLALLDKAEGRQADARQRFERALDIKEQALGAEHPGIVSTLGNLAGVDYDLGDYESARARYARAVAIREQALGGDHPDLGYPLTGLGQTLIALERHAEAVEILERGLALRTNNEVRATLRAETQFVLADALWSAGRDRERALSLAAAARREYAEAGEAQANQVAQIDAWLAER